MLKMRQERLRQRSSFISFCNSLAQYYFLQQDVAENIHQGGGVVMLIHYLPLLEQRPGASDYTKPMKQWRQG